MGYASLQGGISLVVGLTWQVENTGDHCFYSNNHNNLEQLQTNIFFLNHQRAENMIQRNFN